tara:strand:+ start:4687 stop:5925 length:1239 start_codon:yes stop_codon:yes gene_type:complete
MYNNKLIKERFYEDNDNLIIDQIEEKIVLLHLDSIFSELPSGSIIVGGFIRDIITGKTNSVPDIDIVVPDHSYTIGKNLAEKYSGKFLVLDSNRNIVRIIFKKFIIDIANQTENSLIDDLKSRDFTINAISFSLDSRLILDPSNGINDIMNSILKSYDFQNLLKDPLRILRCFRFSAELNFTIDKNLFEFINLNKNKLNSVAPERINYELKKIVKSKEPIQVLLSFNQNKIFNWAQSYENISSYYLEGLNLENFNNFEIEEFISIFYLTEILNEEGFDKFKFSNSDTNKVNSLRKWRNKLQNKLIDDFTEVERFDLHKELENILPAFILYLPPKFHNIWLKRWLDKSDKLFHPQNFLNGNTLKKFIQVQDGPLLGNILNYISREFAFDRIESFDEAIYKAEKWFQQNAPKYD